MYEDLSFEKKRKIFHVSSLIFPLVYLFISKFYLLIALFLILAFTLFLDTSRHYNPKVKSIVDKLFTGIMRENEESGTFRLSGSTYMMGGFFLSALFFSKELAITCWLILIISDPLAALVGIKIGTHKINDKTLEGSAAFLISSLFISMLSYYFLMFNTSFFIIVISCMVTTLLEFYSKKTRINDNLLIPLGYGLTTIMFNFLLNL